MKRDHQHGLITVLQRVTLRDNLGVWRRVNFEGEILNKWIFSSKIGCAVSSSCAENQAVNLIDGICLAPSGITQSKNKSTEIITKIFSTRKRIPTLKVRPGMNRTAKLQNCHPLVAIYKEPHELPAHLLPSLSLRVRENWQN
ncbi:hypothetical protein PIB30_083319 [Stylosanthes scabra]|uniref:Uncharacterized protein n=1 Tax=Stylosanthes scabra TaxID=79078 RepID=A0ABU6URU3_9FABA|nr:hypothetical protein [Stylosanthes scabra]